MPARSFKRPRRAWAPLVVLALFCALAQPAGAVVRFDRATHRTFGVIPAIGQSGGVAGSSRAAAARAGFSCTTACTLLNYNGGPVQHGELVYLFVWAPTAYSSALPGTYVNGMTAWVNELVAADGSSGNPISVNTQYYDLSGPGGTKSFVPYSVHNGGTIVDTGATCLTDAQIRSELSSYIVNHGLPTGLNVEYFVLTPPGVNSCFDAGSSICSYSQYCGYHSAMTVSNNNVTYADLPWAYNVSGQHRVRCRLPEL